MPVTLNPFKGVAMKRIVFAVLAALTLAGIMGCATVPQESAMEWMQRQPMLIDP
jgi:hypothetical protein